MAYPSIKILFYDKIDLISQTIQNSRGITMEKYLNNYAELLVKTGINVQKNQTLVITADIETADFVRKVAKIAYDTGAKNVVVRWQDDQMSRMKFLHAADEVFDQYEDYMESFLNHYVDEGAGFLTIKGTDPELYKGTDPNRMTRFLKAASPKLKYYRSNVMANKNTWCVATVPTPAWAKKVFPGVNEEVAMESLWEAIFKSVRADQDDPVKAWEDHQKNLDEKNKFLTENNFKYLKYKNSLGTDVTVELPEGHVWAGGGDLKDDKYIFFANMPTEEIFTLPHRDGVNGKIVSSIPLNYNGNLVDQFSFTFKDGVVVDYDAEVGYETLKGMLESDEGAKRLGEVALVPYDSPISNQKILFFNTLYDENASCHFALGKAYPTSLKGGENMSDEELLEKGVNDSLIHVDFMVGTEDLEIIGVRHDGQEVPVFKNGNFA